MDMRTVRAVLGAAFVVFAFATNSLAAEKAKDAAKPVAHKGEAVKKLSAEDAAVFTRFTVQRSARFEELAVFQRVAVEKAAELKDVLARLDGEHGLDPKKSYSFDSKALKLYELVPAKKEGDEPEKKEITTYKTKEAAAPLAKEMIARKLVEGQLAVLRQLASEKAQEAELVDKKIRKIFSLEENGIYSFNADDSTIYKTGVREPRPAESKEAKADGAKAKTTK